MNSSDSEYGSDEGDIEVLPPSASQKSASGGTRTGPRLSYSGGGEADPIALLDDEDDHKCDFSRSRQGGNDLSHSQSSRAPVSRNGSSQPMLLPARPQPRTNEAPPSSPTLHSSDSSRSDDSPSLQLDGWTHRRVASTNAPTASQAYDASDSDDSSGSEDSLEKMMRQITRQPRGRPAAVHDDHHRTAPPPAPSSSSRPPSSSQSSATASATPSARSAATQEARAAARERREAERRRKAAEREQARVAKEREKQAKRRAREAKLEAERTAKRRRQELKDESKQRKGGYAAREIAVLMDPALFRHPELTVVDELKEFNYHVTEHASMLGCNAIQYIRRDFVGGTGGARDALAAMRAGDKTGFEHLPVVGIVFVDPCEFLRLLERDDVEEDDYPKLEEWLKSLQAGWRAAWNYEPRQQPRIIVYLHKITQALEQLWIQHRRNKRPAQMAPPSDEELKDAMSWLLIQFQVECVECRESGHLSIELNRLTCKLSDSQYKPSFCDLQLSNKLAPMCDADASLYDQAKDCWLRQLQQVPRVSFNMARSLVRHFPTGRTLWKVYQDDTLTEEEKRSLLVECFGDKTQSKLSDQMYQLMTAQDPNALLI